MTINNKRIRKADIYKMVAKSMAAGTRNRSAVRIATAFNCCVNALREEGLTVEEPIAERASVRSIQKLIELEPKIQ